MKGLGITAYQCVKCGKIHNPYHERCMACKGREFTPIKPEGNARLLTYTVIYNLPWGFDQRFIVVGVVEFENCVRATGQIKPESQESLAPGRIMKPSWGVVRVITGEQVYGLILE